MRIPIALQLALLVLLTTVSGVAVLSIATVTIKATRDNNDQNLTTTCTSSGSPPTIL
jgi:hypothetical protein